MPNLGFAHGRSGVQPTVENPPKDCHGSGGFCGGFLRWMFWSQNPKEKSAEKIRQKSAAENKKSTGARPPRNPPARPKNPAQNLPTNPPVKPPSTRPFFFFDCEGSLLEASSEHGFWDTLWLPSGHGRGSHVEMYLQSVSCCSWDVQGLLRTLPDNTFSQKCSF